LVACAASAGAGVANQILLQKRGLSIDLANLMLYCFGLVGNILIHVFSASNGHQWHADAEETETGSIGDSSALGGNDGDASTGAGRPVIHTFFCVLQLSCLVATVPGCDCAW
jgi:hypothetical protein